MMSENDSQRDQMKEIRIIYLKNVDLISFDRFQESDLMYIFSKLVSWTKKMFYTFHIIVYCNISHSHICSLIEI